MLFFSVLMLNTEKKKVLSESPSASGRKDFIISASE